MAQDRLTPPRRSGPAAPPAQDVPSGRIRHAVLEDGAILAAGDAPEIVVRIAGRGRLLWPGGTPEDRPASTLFLPLGGRLTAHGPVRALRVALRGLRSVLPAGPVDELLAGLVCQRAWHGPPPVAEAALTLVRHLIEAEAGKVAEAGPPGPTGRA